MPRFGRCEHSASAGAGEKARCSRCADPAAGRRRLVLEDPLVADIRRLDLVASKLRSAPPPAR